MVSVDVRIEMTMDQLILNLKDFYDVDFPDLKKYYHAKKRGAWIPRIEFDDDGYLTILHLYSENMKRVSYELFNNIDTRSLFSLGLRNCKIKEIDDNFVKLMKSLKVIDLSKNEISDLPKSIFSPNNSLVSFDISYNELNTLPCEIFQLFKGTGASELWVKIVGNKLVTDYSSIDQNNANKLRSIFCN